MSPDTAIPAAILSADAHAAAILAQPQKIQAPSLKPLAPQAKVNADPAIEASSSRTTTRRALKGRRSSMWR